MNSQSQCVICKQPDAMEYLYDAEEHECGYCGRYICPQWIGRTKYAADVDSRRHLLAGLVRNMNELNGGEYFTLPHKFWESWANVIKGSPLPIPGDTDVVAKAEMVLRHLQRKSQCLGQGVALRTCMDYQVGFCKSELEFKFISDFMVERDWIQESPPEQHNPDIHFSTKWFFITPTGWAYLAGVGAEAKDQGFIAMSFDKAFDDLHIKGLKEGIGNAGHQPLRISQKEHNNHIDDEIIAEIRKSRFVVADLTTNNPGAYFEAGFALGLGKPVAWTCREADIAAKKVHFDTRQYSIVPWTENEWPDFANRLTQRIEATIGRGRYKPA